MEKLRRSSGILMHITSLPNDIGYGCFSSACNEFIDYLAEGGFKCWQVLPFTDCLYDNSPYSAISSFAINPYFLDLKKYLTIEEIYQFCFDKENDREEEKKKFDNALELVYKNCRKNFKFDDFEKNNKYWLDDYACFKVLKKINNDKPWNEWPIGIRNRIKVELDSFKVNYKTEIDKVKFIQYLLDKDWQEIKKYARDRNIEIFGDVPFYVELDSADVWANPKNWQLENGKPKVVAGVPPDYFNVDGQLWGYPIYNFSAMAKNKYDFWQKRIKRLSDMFDIVRIDHFVAFSRYWAIPATSTTAKNGKWVKGVGNTLLKTLTSRCKVKLVAEDLGIVTDDVIALKDKFGIPGIKVMQFAFNSDGDNMYQPHNYEKNCVAYIGTHDNNTFMGMLNEGHWDKINRFKRYLRMPIEYGNDAVIENSIISLYRSSANMVILTMQDMLQLGEESRMNVPGVMQGNWKWQLQGELNKNILYKYRELSELYGR